MKWFKKFFQRKCVKQIETSAKVGENLRLKIDSLSHYAYPETKRSREATVSVDNEICALTTVKNFHGDTLSEFAMESEWVVLKREQLMQPKVQHQLARSDAITSLCKTLSEKNVNKRVAVVIAKPPACHCDDISLSDYVPEPRPNIFRRFYNSVCHLWRSFWNKVKSCCTLCFAQPKQDVTVDTSEYEGEQCVSLKEYFLSAGRVRALRGGRTTRGAGAALRAYALHLAQDKSTTFAQNIDNFIACTLDSKDTCPQVMMRNMRQFMSGMKNYLVKHGEREFEKEVEKERLKEESDATPGGGVPEAKQANLQPPRRNWPIPSQACADSVWVSLPLNSINRQSNLLRSTEFLNLDAILEVVMHRLVVRPLRARLYALLAARHAPSVRRLHAAVERAQHATPLQLGVKESTRVPSAAVLAVISKHFLKMQEADSPLDKLENLLAAISVMFNAIRGERTVGADDLLPVLAWTVARCRLVCAELEAELMAGLLPAALLSGEGGYYLTALFSAVAVLKRLAPDTGPDTASPWRRGSIEGSDGSGGCAVVRVALPDECRGSIRRVALPCRPGARARDLCRALAHAAAITNPQDYALFALHDGLETMLSENDCPQEVMSEKTGQNFILAYKRIDAKIAWPQQALLSYP